MKSTIAICFFLSCANALKLRNQSPTELCGDSQVDPLVAPVVRELNSFWGKRNYSLYPGAVSAIGSLRYGGNSVRVNDELHMPDHDLDFLLVGPPKMDLKGPEVTMQNPKLWSHLLSKGILAGQFLRGIDALGGPNVLNARILTKNLKDDAGTPYYHEWFRIPTKKNEMTLKYMVEQAQINSDLVNGIIGEKGTKSLSKFEDRAKHLNRAVFPSKEFIMAPYIHFDFFIPMGPQERFQPHLTKKMLFHGVNMRYPQDPSMLVKSVQMSFWDPKSASHKKAGHFNICEFAQPGSFGGDVVKTTKSIAVAKQCSAALNHHGYESLHGC